jgi:hypothetical protein
MVAESKMAGILKYPLNHSISIRFQQKTNSQDGINFQNGEIYLKISLFLSIFDRIRQVNAF